MRRGPHPAPTWAPPRKGLRSAARAKLLNKVGAGRGSNLLKYDVRDRRRRLTSSHKKVFAPQKVLRSAGGPKLLKWGLPGRGSNLLIKVRPTPYVYYPRVRAVNRESVRPPPSRKREGRGVHVTCVVPERVRRPGALSSSESSRSCARLRVHSSYGIKAYFDFCCFLRLSSCSCRVDPPRTRPRS